jgi:phage-related protein
MPCSVIVWPRMTLPLATVTGGGQKRVYRRQWRDYETPAGNRPVKEFLKGLSADERAAIYAAMKEVREEGLGAAKHLDGDVWEVKADTADKFFRILFAPEGRYGQVLLALEGFAKKTRKTPPQTLRLAKKRLSDWRKRSSLRYR